MVTRIFYNGNVDSVPFLERKKKFGLKSFINVATLTSQASSEDDSGNNNNDDNGYVFGYPLNYRLYQPII